MPGVGVDCWHKARDSWRSVDSHRLWPRCPEPRSPLLWYNELAGCFIEMGLKSVPDTNCLFSNDKLIVFFYVDDIVVLCHPSNRSLYARFREEFLKAYKMRERGELKWFPHSARFGSVRTRILPRSVTDTDDQIMPLRRPKHQWLLNNLAVTRAVQPRTRSSTTHQK